MSDASSSPRTPTLWWVGAVVLVAVGVGGYALAGRDDPQPTTPSCPDPPLLAFEADASWARDWQRPAAGARGILERDLQQWGERWTTARAQACEQPEPTATVQCLDRQAALANALATQLAALDATAQPAAWAAARTLPATEDCGAARDAAPSDAEALAVLQRAQAQLAVGLLAQAATTAAEVEVGEDDPARALQRWLVGHGQPPSERRTTWQNALGDAIASDDPALACTIALALAEQTPLDEGLAAAQRWWSLASAHARRLPTVPARQYALLHGQARMLARHGAHEAAVAVFEPALALLESDRGSTHPALVPGLRDAAVSAAALGKLDAAERLADRALELADDALGARHDEARNTLDAVARALRTADAPEKATAWLRIAVERAPEPERGRLLIALGEAYLAAGNHGDATESFERARTWSQQNEDALALPIGLGRAAVAQARGDADTASEHLEALLALPLQPDERAAVRLRQVAILLDAERLTEARTAATEALTTTSADGVGDDKRGEALTVAADVALRTERPQEAIALARRAVALLVRAHGPDHPAVLVALSHLGTGCLQADRNDEAAAAFDRARRLSRTSAPEIRVAATLGHATALWRTGAREEAAAVVRDLHGEVAQAARPGAAADLAAWLSQRDLPLAP